MHISTDAYFQGGNKDGFFHANRLTKGQLFSLVVTMDRAAASNKNVTVHRSRNRRALQLSRNRLPNAAAPKPLDTTDYQLLVTAPAGFTHRATQADPKLEPTTLLRPELQGANTLLWPRVPLPQYADTRAVQVFRVVYTVTSATAPGKQSFTASIGRGGQKIHESTTDVSMWGL